MENNLRLSVSDFVALTNQTLEYAYPSIEIEGEIAEFKVNQGKYVFFNLKDTESSVGCFMMLFQLRLPIEDGMKVVAKARPKLTKWGKFSLTIDQIRPLGEGSLKKSFELLKAKLDKEGLFAPDRKRPLPDIPTKIAVISSETAAGYADFIKILGDRWRGIEVELAHVQVQGEGATDQIIRALEYFNTQPILADVVVLIRGGGSADDLSVFNDELLVRAVAGSRIPVLTGIGHEIDQSLVDLAADLAASTPSNAAQLVVPDRREMIARSKQAVLQIVHRTERMTEELQREVLLKLEQALEQIEGHHAQATRELSWRKETLSAYNPRRVLERGYAFVRGQAEVGKTIEIETKDHIITAEVHHVSDK